MNYYWNIIDKSGQDEIGYIENYNILSSEGGERFAYVNMYYMPLFTNDVSKNIEKKIISVIIKWDCDVIALTDGSKNYLIEDLEEKINFNEKTYFS